MLTWEKRTYHNIVWPEQQRLPSPRKEINRDEFLAMMCSSHHCLEGIHFGGAYLIPDDQPIDYSSLYNVQYFWFPHYGLAAATKFTMATEAVFGNDHVFTGKFRNKRFPPENLVIPCDVSGNVVTPENLSTNSQGYVHLMRFFKIGCEHKNLFEVGGTAMFDHLYRCPDCGLEYRTDSSG